ncbi:MAG: MBL fold metallo-hydrolase [Deltaproteobacteria bacterium]|nr:MBL fold metallo-hydrolase [Deltaproteobacteria bacterium]
MMKKDFEIRFWGTRGSIARPGKEFSKFGGNTSCVSIACQNNLYICDAGTGLKNLGDELAKHNPYQNIFIIVSHFHLDHVAGLPFFAPFYKKNHNIFLTGPASSVSKLKTSLNKIFDRELFPVNWNQLLGKPKLLTHKEIMQKANATLDFIRLNHPGQTYGLKITTGSKSVVYFCDQEPLNQFEHLPKRQIANHKKNTQKFLQQTSVLISDAHFFNNQYKQHRGWGHSSWQHAIALASEAHAKKLILTHHAPENTDKDIAYQIKNLKDSKTKEFKIDVAREGMSILV